MEYDKSMCNVMKHIKHGEPRGLQDISPVRLQYESMTLARWLMIRYSLPYQVNLRQEANHLCVSPRPLSADI